MDSFESDVTKCTALVCQGPVKKRRIDEFITNAVACTISQRGLAVSSGAFVRAHPDLLSRSDSAYTAFDLRFMKHYISAGFMNFHDVEILSIVYDGFRAGMPIVENLGLALYDVVRERSAWAPLMDRPHMEGHLNVDP